MKNQDQEMNEIEIILGLNSTKMTVPKNIAWLAYQEAIQAVVELVRSREQK